MVSLSSLAEKVSPAEWKDTKTEPVTRPLTNVLFFVVYGALLLAYFIYASILWYRAPPIVTFSSHEAKEFGPTALNISIECEACNRHSSGDLWRVIQNYTGYEHCSDAGLSPVVRKDQDATSVKLCRTTDNIVDKSGVRVWVGNMTLHEKRASLVVTDAEGALEVTTPLESWHEKTLILGMTVNRNNEDCTSASDCKLTKELYLASMQYDGRVDWGGETWAGGQLNIRMLRFAAVYTTVPGQTWMDVLANVGGQSGVLLAVCGIGLKLAYYVQDKYLHNAAAAEDKSTV